MTMMIILKDIHKLKKLSQLLHDILKPYISDHDFRSSNDGNNIGYNLYVFDIRYRKNFESAQPVKVQFKFDKVIPANIYSYPLALTNKLVSISLDGQGHFDLI